MTCTEHEAYRCPRFDKSIVGRRRSGACRPFERLKEFPVVARASAELKQRVAEAFADVLEKIACW